MGNNGGEMSRENIAEMTKKFLAEGNEIEKMPNPFVHIDVFWWDQCWKGKNPKSHYNWTPEREMTAKYRWEHELCPYNVFILNNEFEEYWNLHIEPLLESEEMEDIAKMGRFESEIRWS